MKELLEKDVFVLDEIEGNFIEIVTELLEQFSTDNDPFEHDSTWTDFRKEDKVGFALPSVDFLLKQLNFLIKQEVLLPEVDIVLGFFGLIKVLKLILESLQIVSDIVVFSIAIGPQPL